MLLVLLGRMVMVHIYTLLAST